MSESHTASVRICPNQLPEPPRFDGILARNNVEASLVDVVVEGSGLAGVAAARLTLSLYLEGARPMYHTNTQLTHAHMHMYVYTHISTHVHTYICMVT